MKDHAGTDAPQPALIRRLLPQLSCITLFFCVTGAGMATVPLFVSVDLGLGPAAIGVIAGAQFVTGVALRLRAGQYADRHGPKRTLISGLQMAVLAGVLCIAAYLLRELSLVAAGVLLAGRILLGGAESFVMAGGQTWALAVSGPLRAAQVIGWVGTAMFTAMAVGAPVGGAAYAAWGFGAVGLFMALTPAAVLAGGLFMALAPAAVLAVVARLPGVQTAAGQPLRFAAVFRLVLAQGLCICFVAFSYGAMVSFSVLLFLDKGWAPTWAALTLFSLGLVAARVFLGSLPDRMSGAKAPVLSLLVLAAGMAMMAFGEHWAVGLLGAWCAGFGYSLVYPSLARDALRGVPDENRGTALAIFAAFVFVGLGLGSPLLGLIAEAFGTAAVFLFAGAMALVSMTAILALHRLGIMGDRRR